MIHIRYASKQDSDNIAQIHISSWQTAYTGIVPDEVLNNLDPIKRTQQLETQINESPNKYGIVLMENKPAGFISFGKCRDVDCSESDGEIYAIYLHPKYYHQGIGTQLLHWGEKELILMSYKRSYIWVLKENMNARSFYQKNGYQFDGKMKEINIGKPLIEYRYLKKFSIINR